MNIRRILCLALMLITVLALAACTPDTPEEPTTYTVSFDTNGGSSVAAISVKDGEKAIAPTAPTKAGYEFAGWYAGDAAFDFDTAIKADTALTAKWTKLTYTITYKDGENVLNLAPATYDIESAFTLPGATKEHYNFMGWYVDANFETGKQKITTGEEGNITLYAQFTVKNYGITYHLYDGENSDANPSTYNVNSTFPITLGNPTKEGYIFLGWYNNANYTGDAVTEIAGMVGNVTLYASWELDTTVPECTHVDKDDNLECDECGEPFDDGVTPETPPVVSTYTIVYYEGDTVLQLTPAEYTVGITAELPILTKEHYDFLGWYTTATFEEGTKVNSITETTTGDLVLYARFEAVRYTITYNLNGGTNAEGNPTEYVVGDTTVLQNPTKEGHTFAGWYTDPYFKNNIATLNGKTGDLVLYAKWVQTGSSGILTPEDKFD